MIEIGSGANYRIAVDTMKNRLYFSFFGDLMRAEDGAHLLKHTDEALRKLKPGFTMLGDMVGVKMLGLPDVALQVQTILVEAGVSRIAAVWSRESFSKLVVESSAQKVGAAYTDKRKSFTDVAEAEAWLDAPR